MRSYEMMLILSPELDAEAVEATKTRITDILSQNGGELSEYELWGKRRLAYELKDYREGTYLLTHFKGQSDTVNELDRVLKISDQVLRYMIVRKED